EASSRTCERSRLTERRSITSMPASLPRTGAVLASFRVCSRAFSSARRSHLSSAIPVMASPTQVTAATTTADMPAAVTSGAETSTAEIQVVTSGAVTSAVATSVAVISGAVTSAVATSAKLRPESHDQGSASGRCGRNDGGEGDVLRRYTPEREACALGEHEAGALEGEGAVAQDRRRGTDEQPVKAYGPGRAESRHHHHADTPRAAPTH